VGELEEEVEGRKRGVKGWEGLEGEDFPGKFGKPPDRQIRQGPPSPKTRDRHPFGGDHLPPPSPPCLRPYVWRSWFFT